jgi:hypothetical protein
MLTLLLTLTWALPAVAVGTLDQGNISVDKDYVSPTIESGKARTVKVTLDNEDLNSTQSVRDGGDEGPVTIEVTTSLSATQTGAFRVQLNDTTPGFDMTVPDGKDADTDRDTTQAAATRILPIVGSVVVDSDTANNVEDALGTPRVVNAKTGLIEFPLLDNIVGRVGTTDGAKIILSYDTSKSETALVNVRGEGNLDLLLVEGSAQGEYSESFVVDDPADVTMNNNAVIHEQHSIPSGLRGYVASDNETISTFYYNADANANAYNEARGTLSGAEAYQAAADSSSGIASEQTFYARVANPPIRDGQDAGDDVTIVDVRHDAPSDVTVRLENAQQGILSFTTSNVFDGFSGSDIEVDYVGSDSFYITVNHGPIDLGNVSELSSIDISDIDKVAPSVSAGTIKIVLPTTDDDTSSPDADKAFDLVSIGNDGTNCADCRVRIGVVTGPKDRDDPAPLANRYSVLGISYSGLERVDIPDGRHGANGPDSESVHLFSRVLAFAPADMDATTEGVQHDITVVKTSNDIGASDITVAMMDDKPRINGRTVWFSMDAMALVGSEAATDNDTFDITYTREVGVLPRNALNPDAMMRPMVALANGARLRVSSANDSTSVDAETRGPSFSNAMPAHKSGSSSNSELLSIDVSDALSGVKKNTIMFKVRAGTGAVRTVANGDLTITDIEGGYRASIALNEVRSMGSGATLNVSTSRETAINWYAMASDIAGNAATSDSNNEKRDKAGADASETQTASARAGYDDCHRRSAGSDDCYTFTVDGVSPSMQRAYTGDWYNSAESRVEGDRRISRDNYLPGSSSKMSVRVVFNEALDGSTVSADDFTVDGTVPDEALWYPTGSTDGADGADTSNGGIRRSVFLTVGQMATDATPAVVLTGSVSDLAGNSVSSGTKTAEDGIAPGATVSVDVGLHKKTVNVTVVTNEAVRLQSPDVLLWVSDALDNGYNRELDETDTFTVERESKTGPDNASNPLVIRDADGELVDGDPTRMGNWNLRLSKAPILDRSSGSRTGDVDRNDIQVQVFRADTPSTPRTDVVTRDLPNSAKVVRNAKNGDITLRISKPLEKGDKIVVTYRGTDPDPANQFPTVPDNVRGVPVTGTANTWTYKLDITRDGKYAVTAEMEDSSLNRGSGGMPDPKASGATVFEIDGELASDSDTDAVTTPQDTANAAFEDPFDIFLHWDNEADEYVGDSNNTVTLTKALLDGEDVSENAVRQDANSYIIEIESISLGRHTLIYNAEDEAGNTNARDRTLDFTVTERPTWRLSLRKGMNLVSLPSNPSNGNVDDVFGGAAEIDLVFTFEKGQALVAVRNPGTGGFAGTLKTIDARHAYWVRASNSAKIEISIPTTSAQTVLPSIAVTGGEWNLVPVLSLGSIASSDAGSGAAPGTLMDADAYLGDFQIAFGWQGGRWMRIDPDPTTGDAAANRLKDDIDEPPQAGDDPLKVGMGYWVLYTDDAFIVPR